MLVVQSCRPPGIQLLEAVEGVESEPGVVGRRSAALVVVGGHVTPVPLQRAQAVPRDQRLGWGGPKPTSKSHPHDAVQ